MAAVDESKRGPSYAGLAILGDKAAAELVVKQRQSCMAGFCEFCGCCEAAQEYQIFSKQDQKNMFLYAKEGVALYF